MKFTIYRPETGIIHSWITAVDEAERDANIPAGCAWIEGEFSPELFFVKDGAAYPYPPREGDYLNFDLASESWLDTREPAQIQAATRDRVKQRRDQAMLAGTALAGMPLPTDDVTQFRITAAAVAAMMDPGYTVRWKLPSGVFVTLVAVEVIAAAQAVRAHVQACFDREAEILAAMEAGEPYDIATGWPD